MLLKLSATCMALSCIMASYAQGTDSTKTPAPATISGSVDAYYRYNFNAPSGATNNYTSFTNSQNSFELGMASIRADHSWGKVSATADLGFGRRAEEFSYNEADHPTLFAVKQLYMSYQVAKALKLTMGKWGTHIGYEVLDAYANRNYSMDYMFSYGPFFHTGIKADITLGAKSGLMIGIANPTDFSTTSSGTKVLLAQFSTGTKDDKLKVFLNYQGYSGVSASKIIAPGYTLYKNLNQFDVVVNATINSKFGIGYNGTVQTVNDGESKKWWGSALYFNLDPTPVFGLTLRGEYFADEKDALKIGANVFDVTLTGLYHVKGGLTIMPEIRLDNGSKEIFSKADGGATKSTGTVLLAAVYKF